jgi:hypothetical protein
MFWGGYGLYLHRRVVLSWGSCHRVYIGFVLGGMGSFTGVGSGSNSKYKVFFYVF